MFLNMFLAHFKFGIIAIVVSQLCNIAAYFSHLELNKISGLFLIDDGRVFLLFPVSLNILKTLSGV